MKSCWRNCNLKAAVRLVMWLKPCPPPLSVKTAPPVTPNVYHLGQDFVIHTQKRYWAPILYLPRRFPFFWRRVVTGLQQKSVRKRWILDKIQWSVRWSQGLFALAYCAGQLLVPQAEESSPARHWCPHVSEIVFSKSPSPAQCSLCSLCFESPVVQWVLAQCLTTSGWLCAVYSSSPGQISSQKESPCTLRSVSRTGPAHIVSMSPECWLSCNLFRVEDFNTSLVSFGIAKSFYVCMVGHGGARPSCRLTERSLWVWLQAFFLHAYILWWGFIYNFCVVCIVVLGFYCVISIIWTINLAKDRPDQRAGAPKDCQNWGAVTARDRHERPPRLRCRNSKRPPRIPTTTEGPEQREPPRTTATAEELEQWEPTMTKVPEQWVPATTGEPEQREVRGRNTAQTQANQYGAGEEGDTVEIQQWQSQRRSVGPQKVSSPLII